MAHSKKFFLLFFFILVLNLSAQSTFYVDPVNGNDSNSGTIDQPFKTISKGLTAIGSNGTLYLRSGIYFSPSKISLSKVGQANNSIKVWAYPGEKPIVDFTGNGSSDGFSISGSYYHIKGLEIKKAGHNGINISGHHNLIENCCVYSNGNTGVHMGSSSSQANPSYNLVLNCDSYFNFDSPQGGNADGFSAKWNVGQGNVFRGCRSFNNSDDGWDLWMCTATITIDSCFAFRNGVDIWHTGQVDGNGNGFKLGGNYVATPHIVKNCLAFDNAGNGGKGFDENNNTAGQTIYNCTSFRNKNDNFHFTNTLVEGQHIFKNNISFQGNYSITSGIQEKNSWQGFTVTTSDFMSIDTSGVTERRDKNGLLPKSDFLRLNATSLLVDAGVDVGIPFTGIAPDLGAFEYGMTMPTNVESSNQIPDEFLLEQNYPNPFNPVTTISYQIPADGHVELKVFDLLGREVASLVNSDQAKGKYRIKFDGSNFSSGIYFYQLRTSNFVGTKKLLILK